MTKDILNCANKIQSELNTILKEIDRLERCRQFRESLFIGGYNFFESANSKPEKEFIITTMILNRRIKLEKLQKEFDELKTE